MPFLGDAEPSRSIPLLGLPRIDWTSHQALGLTHCYRHDVGEAVNLVTGAVDASWQGFDQEDASRFGVGRRANASVSNGDGLTLSAAAECPVTMSMLFTVSDVGTLGNNFFWRDFDAQRRFYNFAGNFMMNWGNNFVPGGSGAGFGAPTDGSPFTIIYACDDGTRTGRYGYYFLNHRTGEYRSATGTHSRNEVANTWQLFYSGTSRVPGVHHEYRVYTDHFIDEAQARAMLADLDGLYEPDLPLYFFPSAGGGNVTGTAALIPGAASVTATGNHGVAGTAALVPGAAAVSTAGAHGVSGSASLTPGAAVIVASGTSGDVIAGTAVLVPGAAAVVASGTHAIAGTAALSPGAASVVASGAHGVSGAATIVPAAAVVVASGALDVVGTAVLQPGAAAVQGAGTHTPPAAAITGTAILVPGAPRVQAWGLKITLPNLSHIGHEEILEVGLPYSVNSIINGALDLIASNGIASLSDSSSHVGNAMKRNFDVERDSLLREYPWNFAMRRAKLASSSTAPAFRFTYAYELPAGPDPEFCLRVWAVGDEDSRTDSDVWEVSGRRLLTDLGPPLPIRYIGRIVNPALWDPLTVKALEARLAWQSAYLASGSAALAEQMARIYQERLDAAKAIDAQEGTPEPFEDGTTWVDSRQAGVHW